MKYYTVLYTRPIYNPFTHKRSTNSDYGYLVGMCGDRSHLRLDGRNTLDTMHQDSRKWAIKHNAVAYRIERGDNLLDLQPISDMVRI